MVPWRTPYREALFGQSGRKTRRFVLLATGFGFVTLLGLGVGQLLLWRWHEMAAHLALEIGAVVLFAGAAGAAVTNAYVNNGLLVSVSFLLALAFGGGLFLVIKALVIGVAVPPQELLRFFRSVVLLLGLIGVGAYLLGVGLRRLVLAHTGP